MAPRLTQENYGKGFLIDEELMGGVAEAEGGFAAFVIRHTTGDYLGYQVYPTLEAALETLAAVKRPWKFESTSGCGACGEGNCSKAQGGGCRKLTGGVTGTQADTEVPCATGTCAPDPS
jgi:hypothetical protein